jgi:hypothetical protein
MLIHDDVYFWQGFGGKLRLGSGKCRLRIYDLGQKESLRMAHLRPTIVIVSDVSDSPMSVRSCSGHIATSVSQDFHIDPSRMMYLEYYPESVYGEHQDHVIAEKYEAVDFNWTEGGAIQPKWRVLKGPLLASIKKIVSDTDASLIDS